MAKYWERYVILAILPSMLLACAASTVSYRYANVSYESPEPALAAQRADFDAVLSKISPTDRPVGGSAVVIVPSIAYAAKHFVEWRGSEPAPELKAQAVTYHATVLVNGFRARGEGFRSGDSLTR